MAHERPAAHGVAHLWRTVYRYAQGLSLLVRRPDIVTFTRDLYDAGERYAVTVLPPEADSSAVVPWLQERVDRSDRTCSISCSIRLIPRGVNPDSRGWRKTAVHLAEWWGYPDAWVGDALPLLTACVPEVHDRLYVDILYWTVPNDQDDGGTPLTAGYASGGGSLPAPAQ